MKRATLLAGLLSVTFFSGDVLAQTTKDLGDLYALPQIDLCNSGSVPDACVLDPKEYYCASERLLSYDPEMFQDLYENMTSDVPQAYTEAEKQYILFREECREEISPTQYSRTEVLTVFCGGDNMGRGGPDCHCFAREAQPSAELLQKYETIVRSFLSAGQIADAGMTQQDWATTLNWYAKCQ